MSRYPKCGVEFSHLVPRGDEVHLVHRCHRSERHYGPHECRCSARHADPFTSFAPADDGRVPTIRIAGRGKWKPLGHNSGLEVQMLEFGSQDGGWAWIQVRETPLNRPEAEDDTRSQSAKDRFAGVKKSQQSPGLPGATALRGAQPPLPQDRHRLIRDNVLRNRRMP